MNSSDIVISLLGTTKKKEWTRSEILDIVAKEHNIGKKDAGSMWDNILSRNDFFDKTSDAPLKYAFSAGGRLRYTNIKKRIEEEQTFQRDVKEFLKIYAWEMFKSCVSEHSELLELNYEDLTKGLPYIAEGLQDDNPADVLTKLNKEIEEITLPIDDDFRPKASVYNFGDVLQVEHIKSAHINRFVEVEGRVVFQSMPKSEIIISAHKCQRCEHITYIKQNRPNAFVEPYECENDVCLRKGPFELLDAPESSYIDAQDILIESLKGQVTIKIHLTGTMCQPPWERDAKVVRVCGIVRAYNTIARNGTKSTSFAWTIEANSIRFADDNNIEPPTDKEKELFESWTKNPVELRQKIIESIAPNIYGSIEIKDACSITLFSDWHWNDDPRDVIERSSIHILLFGDPGVAKSQLAKDTIYLAPKGKFGDVTNMTKGGLSTVAVQEHGEWCVKSGFFSLGDQGITGLDEIDKVDDIGDLKCLGSVLNEQIQRVSKIGKNDIPFNTRTAMICTANPKSGHIEDDGDVVTQITTSIPIHIVQRFDLIYVIRDIPDLEKDAIVADSINELHKSPKTSRKNVERVVPAELFKKYVIYARSKPVPNFSPNAQKLIKEYYLSLRKVSKKYPVIGARQVSNLNRMARAIARREMAGEITEEHVRYAIGLMKYSQSTMTDQEDYGIYSTGRTRSQSQKIKAIHDIIISICKQEKSAKIAEIAFAAGLDEIEVEHTLILMERNREVYKIKNGYRVP